MTVLISRDDAIEMVLTYFIPRSHTGERGEHEEDFVRTIFKELPSAEAEPTVIRSRTLMPSKDFKEWAKRVRETNPNAIVIPCDAEIVSAEAEETVLNKMLEEEMIVLPQDYVKVVRCKDCSHRVHDEERGLYYCGMYYGQGDVSDENFCQWGERSEKE